MNKKILAVVIGIVMVISNYMIVYAATTNSTWDGTSFGTDGEGESKDVTATFNKDETGESVYSVNIKWGSLKYDYDGEVEWDSDNNCYTASDDTATWTPEGYVEGIGTDSDDIVVTNNSESSVNVSIQYSGTSNIVGPVGRLVASGATNETVSKITYSLASKSTGASDAEIVKTSVLEISGKPTEIKATSTDLASGITMGNVLIKITN